MQVTGYVKNVAYIGNKTLSNFTPSLTELAEPPNSSSA